MTGTVTAAIILGVVNLLLGVALGWYLRRANSWCPHCGDRLQCAGCGSQPVWTPAARDTERSSR